MIIYAQAQEGDETKPPLPDCFQAWSGSAGRQRVIDLVAHKFIRERGLRRGDAPVKFTVYTYKDTDPVHENGRPMCVLASTFLATPEPLHP